ncbi:hypothetical protein KUTeg_007100, partial [Tegillarca granosa]
MVSPKLDNEGTDFVVGFMQNLPFCKTYQNIYLMITTSCLTPVKPTITLSFNDEDVELYSVDIYLGLPIDVLASKVISVFSGDAKTEIGLESPKDHLIEQLIPVNKWGQKYLTAPIPGRTVVSSEDNTFLSYICNNSQKIITFSKRLQKAGNVSETLVPSGFYCYVVADKPILLAQFVWIRSQLSIDEETDPSMILIPAIEQYSANYNILVHNMSVGTPYNDNYFMFIIEENEIDGLLIDGGFLSNETDLTVIPGTGYIGGFVSLENGVHNIRHMSSLVCLTPSSVVTAPSESTLDLLHTSLCEPEP